MNILITGGSSGLGKKIIETLNDKYHIYSTYNNSQKDAEFIKSKFKKITFFKCDFTNSIELNQFLKKISLVQFDVLINNFYCGEFLGKHFIKTESTEFINILESNIKPTVEISKTVIKSFKEKKGGLIINISSKAIQNPPIGSALYVCVKSVIEGLSKIWNSELNSYGIRSLSVQPSFMRTKLTSKIDPRIVEIYFEKNSSEIQDIANTIKKIIENQNAI